VGGNADAMGQFDVRHPPVRLQFRENFSVDGVKVGRHGVLGSAGAIHA